MRWQTRARSLRLRSMTRAALFAIAAAIASPAAAQTLPAGLTTPVADDVAALRDAAPKDDVEGDRSEERSVGNAGVSPGYSRWSPYHIKNKQMRNRRKEQ